jgi:hypothetical protein
MTNIIGSAEMWRPLEELRNLYATKKDLERLVVSTQNDAARDAIRAALTETNHQIRKIRNGI